MTNTTPNAEGIKSKPRTIKLVLKDDGGINFNFFIEGDIERIGKVPTSELSAAEFWAIQFYATCQEQLERNGEIKKVPPALEVKRPLIIAP